MNFSFLVRMEAFLFDLDGCIYFGDVPAEGAAELLETLGREGKLVFYLSNNSTQTAHSIASRLSRMGLPAAARQIITPTEWTGAFLKEKYGLLRVKVAGSDDLKGGVKAAGHRIIPDDSEEQAEAVVIGRDTGFHYGKLQWIAEEAARGAVVIGTNPDPFHLGGRGERIPETGALTAAVEAMTGQTIEHIGKPEPYLYQCIVRHYRIKPETAVMVGDNRNTDILGGARAGMRTVWMRGKQNHFALNDRAAEHEPDLTVDSPAHLLQMYRDAARHDEEEEQAYEQPT